MKFIASSKTLIKFLKPIFKDSGETVDRFTISVDGDVTICTEYEKYETFVEPVKRDWFTKDQLIPFISWRWYALYMFLKSIPDQPVVIELDTEGDRIQLQQFVVNF